MKKFAYILGAIAIAAPLSASAVTTTVTTSTTCSSLSSSTSYSMFGGCIAAGNNTFSNVNSIVSSLFGDELISLDPELSFYQGTPTPTKAGAEFKSDRLAVGFDATDGFAGATSVSFSSLPTGTLFLTLKASNGFTLYSAANFAGKTFQSAVTNNNGKQQAISNIGTYGGTTPDLTPVPLPAAGFLLAGALGGLGLMRRRKRSA